MVRAAVKNTFVVLEPEVGDEVDWIAYTQPPRSKSADQARLRPSESDVAEHGVKDVVYSLNRILSTGSSVEPLASGKTPSVDELRDLQRRLSKVMVQTTPVAGGFCAVRNRTSLCSLSTSAPDEDVAASGSQSTLPHTGSSSSVSTMISEWEEESRYTGTEPVNGAHGNQAACSTWRLASGASPKAYQAARRSSRHKPHGSSEFFHARVPRSLNLAEEFSRSNKQAPITTLMIRNIPNRYSQRELIREIDGLGFARSYDFFYMPMDKGTMCNVGYAFINFVDHTWAQRCMRTCDGYCFKKFQGSQNRIKIATVSAAHIQGLQANVRHYENSAVNAGSLGVDAGRSTRQPGPIIMTNIAKRVQRKANSQK